MGAERRSLGSRALPGSGAGAPYFTVSTRRPTCRTANSRRRGRRLYGTASHAEVGDVTCAGEASRRRTSPETIIEWKAGVERQGETWLCRAARDHARGTPVEQPAATLGDTGLSGQADEARPHSHVASPSTYALLAQTTYLRSMAWASVAVNVTRSRRHRFVALDDRRRPSVRQERRAACRQSVKRY